MDEYLKCLYDYVMEHVSASKYPDAEEYYHRMALQDKAWSAVKAALTAEQLKLVEDYQAARAGTWVLEDELLFQAAVSLGKWMVRS